MSRTPDILVVGAGIVGVACAAALARAGLRVLVLERSTLASGTTAAGMGHLVVMDDSEGQFQLTMYSQRLWRELAPQLPAGAEYDPCGTLWVATDAEEMAEVRRKAAFYQSRDVPVEVLDGAALAEAEPNLRPGLAGALRVPLDAVIYPPVATQFMARRAALEIRCHTGVCALHADGTVALEDGSQLSAGQVVIATGCWAPSLLPGLPVRKRKGHLVITDRYPGFLRHQLVELGYLKSAHAVSADSVAFNIQPRKTGQLLVGSSRQFEIEDTEVESDLLARMLARACEFLPGLNRLAAVRC